MIVVGIDIETTGGTHEICEFAAVALEAKSGREIFKVASLVDPGRVEWNPFAMRVHGITLSMVRGKPKIRDVWDDFRAHLVTHGAIARCFAHNASFERTHLQNSLGRSYSLSLECTLALSKTLLEADSYKLPLVCAMLDIPFKESHRAEPDARAAAKVAAKLLRMSPEETARVPIPNPRATLRPRSFL
jgi:DNA polymerase III subunit epsilon